MKIEVTGSLEYNIHPDLYNHNLSKKKRACVIRVNNSKYTLKMECLTTLVDCLDECYMTEIMCSLFLSFLLTLLISSSVKINVV